MQDQSTTRRRSAEAFHSLFAAVSERRDISAYAKLLHAVLVSQHRLKLRWTQAELADRIGAPSRQKIWRLAKELEAAGLIQVCQVGLQQPNEYTVLGIESPTLDGLDDTKPARKQRINNNRRSELIRLYGEMCLRCGATKRLEIDHIIPIAVGGPDIFSNLQLLCKPCNMEKGTRTADYRQSPGVALTPA